MCWYAFCQVARGRLGDLSEDCTRGYDKTANIHARVIGIAVRMRCRCATPAHQPRSVAALCELDAEARECAAEVTDFASCSAVVAGALEAVQHEWPRTGEGEAEIVEFRLRAAK